MRGTSESTTSHKAIIKMPNIDELTIILMVLYGINREKNNPKKRSNRVQKYCRVFNR